MKQIFLLGAGFTRAVMGEKALLTDEIMPKLDISAFPEIINDYVETFPDIEQFITRIDLKYFQFKKTNHSLEKTFEDISENLKNQIAKYFDIDQIGIDDLNNYLHLKTFIKKIPEEATILTLNYDCVLDQGLYLSKRWSPNEGYLLSSFPSTHKRNQELENILLLKLHGSVNFRIPTKDEIEQCKQISDQFVMIEITNQIFPDIHSHINPRGPSNQPYILAMSYLKIYISGIMQIWVKAIEELRKADILTIMGCSIREEDTFLRFVLRHFGEKANTEDFIIEIIDPNELIWKKIEKELIGNRLVGNPDKHIVKSFKSLSDYLPA